MIYFFTWCLIVVDIYPLQLQVTVTLVTTRGIDAMFITYHLPELRGQQTWTHEILGGHLAAKRAVKTS